MFNFNKGQSIEVKQSSSIFNLDEIRDIVLEFPPSKHYTKSESDGRREITWPKFFRLTDGTQHVSWESLISKVQDLLSTEQGWLSIDEMRRHLQINVTDMTDVLKSSELALIFLQGGSHVATKDQERKLWSHLCEIVGNRGKQLKTVVVEMPELSKEGIRLLLLKNLNSPQCSLAVLDIGTAELKADISDSAARSYVLPTKLFHILRNGILESALEISQRKRVIELSPSFFAPIHELEFCTFVEKTLQRSGKEEFYQLHLGSSDGSIFIAHRDWIRAKHDQVKDIAASNGNNGLYLDITTIHNAFASCNDIPKEINVPKLAKWYLKSQAAIRYRCFENSAISGDLFKSILDACLVEMLKFRASRIIDTLPERLHNDRQLVNCIEAEVKAKWDQQDDVCGSYGACLVEENFLRDLRLKLSDDARSTARAGNGNHAYDRQTVIGKFGERNTDYSDKDKQKLARIISELLVDPTTGLEGEAKDAFAREVAVLSAEKQQQLAESEAELLQTQFTKSWSSRVAKEVRVYIEGVKSLSKSPLHDDCKALLFEYLSTLIPKLLKATKNDLHKDRQSGVPSDLGERIEAFEKQVKSATSLDSLLAHMRSFDRSLKIPAYSTSTSDESKRRQFHELCETVEKDENGPRLFLYLVVILWSTSPETQGIVYITGKFSPRLLRLLAERADRGELSEDETKRVQMAMLLKDKVKKETLEDSDVRWIRQAGKEAVENWEQRQSSTHGIQIQEELDNGETEQPADSSDVA